MKIQKTPIIFFATLILFSFVYRICFIYQFSQHVVVVNFYLGYFFLIFGLLSDLVLSAGIMLVFWIMQSLIRKVYPKKIQLPRFIHHAALCFILLTIALIYLIHTKLFTMFIIGFNYNILTNIVQHDLGFSTGIPYMQSLDWIFLFSPLVIFYLLQLISYQRCMDIMIKALSLALIIPASAFIIATLWPVPVKSPLILSLLHLNPVLYLAEDTWHNLTNQYTKRTDRPDKMQLHTVELIDPLFKSSSAATQNTLTAKAATKPYNVVIFVLESVGAHYVFDTSQHPSAMPFLESLSHQGLWLNNNYSSGNNSALGGFGILSGIYPNPTPQHFESFPELYIPSVASWLGKNYDNSFFASVDTAVFFTKGIVNHSFKQFYGPETITTKSRKGLFLAEPFGFNYFLSQLNQLKEPFLSVYWSGAAHSPYFDYGPEYQVDAQTDKSHYRDYVNNLRLLDHEIKLLYQHLKEKDLLKNTIIVVVGDHGEAFGQHANSWGHGTTLHDEQIRVPVLFYQPAIFKPQIINTLTSNVDILPTLLDALRIPVDRRYFQGESLFQKSSHRKYIFVYGNENELAAIDVHEKNKMIIDFSKGTCRLFALAQDSQERNGHSCQLGLEKPMIAFRNYQPEMLLWYNSQTKK